MEKIMTESEAIEFLVNHYRQTLYGMNIRELTDEYNDLIGKGDCSVDNMINALVDEEKCFLGSFGIDGLMNEFKERLDADVEIEED